jgi:hypothetical protein
MGDGTDSLAAIENAIGGDYDDEITGDTGFNVLSGGPMHMGMCSYCYTVGLGDDAISARPAVTMSPADSATTI